MKGLCKKVITLLMLVIVLFALGLPVYADTATEAVETATQEITQEVESENALLGDKAIASAIAIGIAAGLGAIAMGIAVAKSTEGISRQPEAEGKIRTTLMLGLVFIETAIIYALLAVILIIFVI